jgi:hypothetical protein
MAALEFREWETVFSSEITSQEKLLPIFIVHDRLHRPRLTTVVTGAHMFLVLPHHSGCDPWFVLLQPLR